MDDPERITTHQTMNYQQIQPPDYLKSYVQHFWVLESNTLKIFRPIPDGCPGLIFQPTEKGTFYDQHGKQMPSLFLYGQTVQHREIHTNGYFSAMGIRFYPNGLKSIFGFDADELTDTCVDVNVVATKQNLFLAEQLANAPSISHQIEQLSAYLLAQISKKRPQYDKTTQYVLNQMVESKGAVFLKELQQELNVTERSFERKFKRYVGISPKLFSRICRFQASLSQLRTSNYDKLSDIAFDNGYADQSHFIRVFREFAGTVPDQYRKQANDIIQNLPEWL